jgi:hypothetical protein
MPTEAVNCRPLGSGENQSMSMSRRMTSRGSSRLPQFGGAQLAGVTVDVQLLAGGSAAP